MIEEFMRSVYRTSLLFSKDGHQRRYRITGFNSPIQEIFVHDNVKKCRHCNSQFVAISGVLFLPFLPAASSNLGPGSNVSTGIVTDNATFPNRSYSQTAELPKTRIKILWLPTSICNGTPSPIPAYELNAGALSIALTEAYESGLVDSHTTVVELVYRDSMAGNVTFLTETMLQMRATPGSFQMLLGPALSTAARVVNIVAQAIGRLHIVWDATAPELSDRVTYPRVIRPQPSYYLITQCIETFLISQNMTKNLAVISYDDSIQCPFIVSALKQTVQQYNITIASYATLTTNATDDQITAKLRQVSLSSRIIFGCGMLEPANLTLTVQLYRIVAAAKQLGMTAAPYQWILIMTRDSEPLYHPLYLPPKSMPSPAEILRANNISLTMSELTEAMKRVLYTYVHTRNRGDNVWRQKVRDALADAPWNENMTSIRETLRAAGIPDDYSPAYLSGHLADSLTLYLIGVQRARAAGLDYENPYIMYDILRNITFKGYSGYFALNRDGERLPDMSLHGPAADYDSKSMAEKFEVKGNMRCSTDKNIRTDSNGITGSLELNRSFVWYTADGLPPVNPPICGYQGELCRFDSTYVIVSVVGGLTALVLIVSVLGWFVSQQRRKAELLRMDWLLEPSEINEKQPASISASVLELFRGSQTSLCTKRSSADQGVDSLNNTVRLDSSRRDVPKSTAESFDEDPTSATDLNTDAMAGFSVLKQTFRRATYRNNQVALYKWPWTPAGIRLSKHDDSKRRASVNDIVSTVPFQSSSNVAEKTALTPYVLEHRECLHELLAMRRLNHDNTCAFIGAYYEVESRHLVFVHTHCAKGTLSCVLRRHQNWQNHQPLAWFFKQSILLDIALGLDYLQNSTQLEFHGRLSSDYIVIDSRWVTKITGFGGWSFGIEHPEDIMLFKGADEDELEVYRRRLLWTAPEILRQPNMLDDFVYTSATSACRGSAATKRHDVTAALKRADVYSFGVIMSEVIYDVPPYAERLTSNGKNVKPSEIVREVVRGVQKTEELVRPLSDKDAALEGINVDDVAPVSSCRRLMVRCWAEDPLDRPTVKHVCRSLRAEARARGAGSLVDTVIAKLELYAKDLESLVQARTNDLQEEKRRADGLLRRLLPEPIAEQLKRGEPVVPQTYDSASVYFSDIVSFTTIASLLTPLAVVDLLNKVFMHMDDVSSRYAVYKMETIGDGYMVVSGLPERISTHAAELASMALDIRNGMARVSFESLERRPTQSICIRLGLHSGPVVVGVVGLTMPRYCLFGDTVNVASRMESQGEPMQIQISESTRQLLGAEYSGRPRGAIEIKGKGLMHTYWLDDGPTRR